MSYLFLEAVMRSQGVTNAVRQPVPSGCRPWVQRHPAAAYTALALVFSWAFWIPLAASGVVLFAGGAEPLYILGLVGPMAAAFVTAGIAGGAAGVRDLIRRTVRWRVQARWLLVAVFGPAVLFLCAAALMRLGGAPWPRWEDLGRVDGLPSAGLPAVWLMVVLLQGFGAETGWRGFALPQLRRDRSIVRSALVISIPWALCEAPSLFFLESFVDVRPIALAGFVLGLAAGSVLLAWVYERSGGSIPAAALAHSSFRIAAGSVAAQGLPALIVTALAIVWGGGLAIRLRRGPRRAQAD